MSSESWFGHQSRLVRPSRDRSAAGSFTGQDSGSLLVFASIARFLSASPGTGILGHAPPGGNCEGHVIFPMTVLNLLHERGPRRRRSLSRSEEHTSELQSLMRISYAVF